MSHPIQSICPCNSLLAYEQCCGLYLENHQLPHTPEALMRSRYTAYSLGRMNYIKSTMKGETLIKFEALEAENWAKRVTWIRLEVIKAYQETPEKGFVEFKAHFMEDNRLIILHELSEFLKENEVWFYTAAIDTQTLKPNTSRNASCPCNSGKKFKNCHDRVVS